MRKKIDIEIFKRSPFRLKFSLEEREKQYAKSKGFETIHSHARDFVTSRLSPANPNKDGKQTPMRGHPVFIAQHATATCCRKCLQKWHFIPMGREMTPGEVDYAVAFILSWIAKELKT